MSDEKKHYCPNCSCSEGSESQPASHELINGWKLGLASACVFLLPLMGMLLGIIVANIVGVGELTGGAVGLLAGFGLAVGVSRFFRK